MANLNLCQFIGNLGADPEVRYTAGGDAVASMRIACTESWKDKNTGEKRERTEWVRIIFWGKLAEICGQYLKKGSAVYVSGRLTTRKWQDKDGQDRYTTEITGEALQMLGDPRRNDRGDGSDGYGPPPDRRAPPANGGQGSGNPSSGNRPNFDDLGDDIPFQSTPRRGPLAHVFTD